jgi:hypothetical protein
MNQHTTKLLLLQAVMASRSPDKQLNFNRPASSLNATYLWAEKVIEEDKKEKLARDLSEQRQAELWEERGKGDEEAAGIVGRYLGDFDDDTVTESLIIDRRLHTGAVGGGGGGGGGGIGAEASRVLRFSDAQDGRGGAGGETWSHRGQGGGGSPSSLGTEVELPGGERLVGDGGGRGGEEAEAREQKLDTTCDTTQPTESSGWAKRRAAQPSSWANSLVAQGFRTSLNPTP